MKISYGVADFERMRTGGFLSGKELRALVETALYALEPVREALDEAEEQARGYRDVLMARQGEDPRLKTYAVVSVGFDRLAGREVPALDVQTVSENHQA